MKKNHHPYPDITISAITFSPKLLYWGFVYNDTRYHDVILPVPWYIVMSGFRCSTIQYLTRKIS